ncbi:GNAT family N-acetyltransferase [Uliginosibacterium paludis]|uniref:GNAT family N-acetyltransferase n=1 Tax=Uliginosibacterium paludis TaxID=1615952 RepID=A0ABV2CNT8_9RHOO
MWIRQALQTDAAVLGELHAASWRLAYRGALSDEFLDTDVVSNRREFWEARLAQPEPSQQVFLSGNEAGATGFCCVFGDHAPALGAFLNNLHVMASAQRQGYGRALLHAAATSSLASAPDRGMFLFVLQGNLAAQAFYTRFGARMAGTEQWDAPGGGRIPLFKMHWPSLRALADATTGFAAPE